MKPVVGLIKISYETLKNIMRIQGSRISENLFDQQDHYLTPALCWEIEKKGKIYIYPACIKKYSAYFFLKK